MTSNAYSSPSVVFAPQNHDGSQHIIDDFYGVCYSLRQNTPETTVVMSCGTMDIRWPVWLTGRLWLTVSLRITVSHSLLPFAFADVTLASAHRNSWQCHVKFWGGFLSHPPQARCRLRSRHHWWASRLRKVFGPTRYRNPIISPIQS